MMSSERLGGQKVKASDEEEERGKQKDTRKCI